MAVKINKELLKGSTVILVLSLLERAPMYGYQMIKEIEIKSGGVFNFKEGTLYPILHALESDGLIESYWQGNEGSRQRKYYRITGKGSNCLKEKQQEWITFSSAMDKILKREVCGWSRPGTQP
jgi:PadR family transcriptional regulator PadR